MDISKHDAKVCVRIQHRSRATTTVTTWPALSSKILELAEYLAGQQVTLVVMEATGDYWKPFYYLLAEAGLTVILVNPSQARQFPGRKTDIADAVWLADLAAHGLLRASFVPPRAIGELKDLVRTRTTLIRLRGAEAQRLEKLLESAAIKLSGTISDLLGLSGRRMLAAMIAGVEDPAALAALADGRIKASPEELREALTGRFTDHHRFLTQVHLDLIDHYTTQIGHLEQRIHDHITHDEGDGPGSIAAQRDLLTTIPGISTVTAERIIAEIGTDMTVFPTPGRLTSWAGIAPGSHESAGKIKSSRCRPGNTHLKAALGIAALSTLRSKNTFFAARYQRVASRRGHHRALVAVQRSMLTAVWHVLTTSQPYHDPGIDYYIRRRPGPVIARALKQLRTAGLTITINAPGQAVVT